MALLAAGRSRAAPEAKGPTTTIWAWERPEDLRRIDPQSISVAFLARTLTLQSERVAVRPRMQPLQVPPGTRLIAVVRIESRIDQGSALDDLLGDATRASAAALAPGIQELQIDFDARVSERAFYRRLLAGVRATLPSSVPLSITALASWCMADRWIDGLPIDEAVPMLFRMGVDDANVRRHLAAGGDFSAAACRTSVGISTDERQPTVPAGRKRYVFNPRAWSDEAIRRLMEESRR
jgi:Protein of unknown function (DUF3142)